MTKFGGVLFVFALVMFFVLIFSPVFLLITTVRINDHIHYLLCHTVIFFCSLLVSWILDIKKGFLCVRTGFTWTGKRDWVWQYFYVYLDSTDRSFLFNIFLTTDMSCHIQVGKIAIGGALALLFTAVSCLKLYDHCMYIQ
jgi:hypothetical protein